MEGSDAGAQFLRLDAADVLDANAAAGSSDAFAVQASMPGTAIVADRAMLQGMTLADVVVRRWPNPHIPVQYFHVVDPDADIVVAPCGHFFEAGEYELLSMTLGHRPFSHAPLDGLGAS